MNILADFHHSSLLKSLQLLFEERLDHTLMRPIGMEWFTEGYWKINDLPDTAKQYLDLEQAFIPPDGTWPLNKFKVEKSEGLRIVGNPGNESSHLACTLEYFKDNKFDILIASLPQHIEPFKELIRLYQPQAKLIFQVGNNWDFEQCKGMNVLASTARRDVSIEVNVHFYHQEIDLKKFTFTPPMATGKVYSFINILQNTSGWEDFRKLEEMTQYFGLEWKSFGGQCRDGNMNGDYELSRAMYEAMVIFHVKPGGDGFGHIIHNAYACGRPIITRSSHYRGQLAERLMVPGTFIDLDMHSLPDVKNMLHKMVSAPEILQEMGARAAQRFTEVVDYDEETRSIKAWLGGLL